MYRRSEGRNLIAGFSKNPCVPKTRFNAKLRFSRLSTENVKIPCYRSVCPIEYDSYDNYGDDDTLLKSQIVIQITILNIFNTFI